MKKKLKAKFSKIKLLVTDFDGIHTDGKVYVTQDGKETVVCSRKDGLGINMLRKAGIAVIVISKETNSVVKARCKKLGILCWQKVENGQGKLEILLQRTTKLGLVSEEIAFMGDDVNDIPALKVAGVAITVKDGHPLVKKVADYVTLRNGGDHAIREVAELILEAQGHNVDY